MKNYLVIALSIGFLLLGFNAYQEAKPVSKAPIYKEVKKYSPYYLEKRFGGLEILSKKDSSFKEKPDNMNIFHRLEFLEKEWGKKHLKIKEKELIVYDDNQTELKRIPISTKKDNDFLHNFYGI